MDGLEDLSLGHQAEIGRVEEALFGERSPVSVGRFEIVRTIGRGAFGTVYEARDPQLQRAVALKVLGADDAEAQGRLLREAQVMATVTHPNIATVYEVGTFEHQGGTKVFVAMEFVDGVTLRQHLAERAARPREIAGLMVQAGRGLAAAHAAGVVHRDLKPDNILIGREGRVRVVDFGLAFSATDEASHNIAGTPAYMAPEVLDQAPADALSDQFSFCVTLWEALFGSRPYPGKTVADLVHAFDDGVVPEPPARSTVPPRLRRIALRGLDVDPAQRYPSMDALLGELTARSWFSARNLAIVAAVAATAGAAGAILSRGALRLAPKCRLDPGAVEASWSPQVQTKLADAFVAAAPTYGAESWSRTQTRIDAYLERWKETTIAVCERDWTTEEASALRELEAACLQRAKGRVEGVIDALAGGERVRDAVSLVSQLPDVARCTDASTLLAANPQDPAERARAEEIRDGISAALTELADARHEEAAARLQALAEDAQALGFTPVIAEVAVARAHFELVAGRPAESRAHAREAFDAALTADAVRTALSAVLLLAQAGVADRHLVEDGTAWIKTADSLLTRLGPDRHFEGRLAMARASLAIVGGENDVATAALERAVTLLPEDDPELVTANGNWGTLLLQQGRPADAVARYQQALAAAERTLGPDHPDVATWLLGLGSASMTLGDLDQAETYLRRSLRIHLDTVGEGHPNAIQTRMYLGVLSHNRTEFDEGIDQFRRALAAAEEHLGKTHPLVAEICLRFGDMLSLAGKHDEAARILDRARQIYEDMLPAGDPGLAPIYATALVAAARAGRLDEAIDHGRRGLELSTGDGDPITVNLLHETARAMLQAGRHQEAVELLRRAASSLTSQVHDPRRRALVEFELAMALYPNDHTDGRTHAESALEVQPTDVPPEEREQITRWLAEHP